jgi:hypothetical protein
MRIICVIVLFLILAACRTADTHSADPGTENSVMGPSQKLYYPDEGVSFEVGGSVEIGAYSSNRKSKASEKQTPSKKP